MTRLKRVYKKSTKDKNLAVSALDRISMLTGEEAGSIQKESPRMRELQPYGGKAQSRPPAGVDIVLPSSAESSSTCSDKKSKNVLLQLSGRAPKHYADAKRPDVSSRRNRAHHAVCCGARPTKRGSWNCWKSFSPKRGKAKLTNGTPALWCIGEATAKLLPRSNGEKCGLAAVEATVDGVDNPSGAAPGFGEPLP